MKFSVGDWVTSSSIPGACRSNANKPMIILGRAGGFSEVFLMVKVVGKETEYIAHEEELTLYCEDKEVMNLIKEL